MPLDNYLDPEVWRLGMDLVGKDPLNGPSQAFEDRLVRHGVELLALRSWPADGILPGVFLAVTRHVNYLALVGMRNIVQAERLLLSATQSDRTNPYIRLPPSAYDAGRVIRDRILADDLSFRGPVIVFGHSYGGYCTPATLYHFHRLFPDERYSAVTYGSPRSVVQGFSQTLQRNNICRVFVRTDVVCKVAPRRDESVLYHGVLTSGESDSTNMMQHIGFSRRIELNGAVTEGDEESFAEAYNGLGYLAWMYRSFAGVDTVHSWASFDRRLRDIPSLPDPLVPRPLATGTILNQGDPGVIYPVTVSHPAAVDAVREAVRVSPNLSPLRSVRRPFSIRRQGAAWDVLSSGQVVATYGNRQHASRVAAAGNRFLASLRSVQNIGSDALTDAIDAWIAANTP